VPVPLPPATTPVRAEPTTTRFALGAGALATIGPAPKALFGPLAFGELEWSRSSVWSPLVRLGIAGARTGTIGPDFDEADFGWAALRAELCPLRLELSTGASIRPCAFADLGLERVEGKSGVVDNPKGHTRLWSSAGVSAWLRFDLGESLFVSLGGGVAGALTRDHYVFERPAREVVYDVPALTIHAAILVGYDFE
jgi:hypothetical protein